MNANRDTMITDAERELRDRIVEVLETAAEGNALGGATVANVESFGLAEDGRTLVVTVELTDGRLAMFQFAPGQPITAHVVA